MKYVMIVKSNPRKKIGFTVKEKAGTAGNGNVAVVEKDICINQIEAENRILRI
jgi:hypothetical protein